MSESVYNWTTACGVGVGVVPPSGSFAGSSCGVFRALAGLKAGVLGQRSLPGVLNARRTLL